jgi:phosphate starvation-inducible PhoH-like protein
LKGRNNTPVTKKVKSDENRDTSLLRPLNDRQADYIDAIKNESIVICTGVWGSAKTYIPSVMACDLLLAKKIEKVIVARPAEGVGKSLGYFKGDKNQKLEGWCAPIMDIFEKRLGRGNLEAFLENGRVELLALEQVKGRSWDDTFIIVDEVEDISGPVAKSLVSRQGINSKIVLTGDINQQDLKAYSGLQMLMDVADYTNLDIAMIDFDSWDYCVRSDEAKMWGQAFEAYEKEHGRVK